MTTNAIDVTLFLWLNATPATSDAWLVLGRFASERLPMLAILGLLPLALLGPQQRRQVLGTLLAMLLAWLAVRGLRGAFEWPRPFMLGLGTQWMAHANTPTFPSFHAAVAGAWAASLVAGAHRQVAVWALVCASVALLVAWSRVFLGLHFVSDVGMGLALGVGCAVLTHSALARTTGGWRLLRSGQGGSEIR